MVYRKNIALLTIFLVIGLLSNSGIVMSAEQVVLKVKLTIVEPTCTINENKEVNVVFGDVLSQKVDGKNYIKTVEYGLKCTGDDSQNFNMTILGTATSFNDGALKTNIADFGIAMFANDKPLKINDSIKFSPSKKPVLQVVPIKVPNKALQGGDFSANAVMQISYQ